ncbi:hypothetical protein GF336_07110 [Candidatus Woesearchaeota archaeon]|nr:hypothetical protein [Candidatus Woesearchaeota archaeon]
MENTNKKRQVAIKVWIKSIIEGKYVKEEGWNPNHVDIGGKRISRVNLMGVVTDIEPDVDYNSFVIEDSSGRISVRDFEGKKIENIGIGDAVMIIGRPKEYGDERYVLLEILKKIENKGWIEYRKLELENQKQDGEEESEKEISEKADQAQEVTVEEVKGEEKNESYNIIDKINELDKGDGVDIEELVEKSGKSEEVINRLLSEGEIFEVKPGRVKVL